MHPRNLLAVSAHSIPADTALLLLRIVAGVAFMLHGWGKIQHPFSWMGPDMPGFLQALAALSEFGGGAAWALGLLTPLASIVSGGPKTPHEQRAVQIAVAKALRDWVKRE